MRAIRTTFVGCRDSAIGDTEVTDSAVLGGVVEVVSLNLHEL